MSRAAVIFDTNSCRSIRTDQSFFGNRNILLDISSRATIILPQIVIDELIQQNAEGAKANINSLRNNTLLDVFEFDRQTLEQFDSYTHATSLLENEPIKYMVIDILNLKKAYEKIKEWAIKGKAPFNKRTEDGKNNSDKGFKDALIACSVDDFIKSKTFDKYYLVCDDGRLKEYYKDSRYLTCMDAASVLSDLDREFFDDYMLSVIRDTISMPKAELKESWTNIDSDVVGLFGYEEYETVVIVDSVSKEVISYADFLSVSGYDSFTSSGSFSITHSLTGDIVESLQFYKPADLEHIKSALVVNDQVYGIGTDEDVKTIAQKVFEYFKSDLTDQELEHFNVYYNIRDRL